MLTPIVSVAVWPFAVTLTVHEPAPTGVTVNVVPCAGVIEATSPQPFGVATKLPLYDASVAVTVCAAALPVPVNASDPGVRTIAAAGTAVGEALGEALGVGLGDALGVGLGVGLGVAMTTLGGAAAGEPAQPAVAVAAASNAPPPKNRMRIPMAVRRDVIVLTMATGSASAPAPSAKHGPNKPA